MFITVLSLAGLSVQVSCQSRGTVTYFRDFEDADRDGRPFDIVVPPVGREAILREKERLGSDLAFAEYSLLIEGFANRVLPHGRFLFHGAAFLWRGKAFILTGKSGVGKTTQLRHWKRMYPEEIRLINGDKPLVEVRDGRFYVHPSPWTGKEGWNGTVSGELAGIILLEQGKTDRIRRLPVKEAVFPVFLQFLYIPEGPEALDRVCAYEEALLEKVPVWKLVNRGGPASSALAHDTLLKEGF